MAVSKRFCNDKLVPETSDILVSGWVFDIQRYSINDGPGIRTTVFFKGCPLTCLWCDNPESQYSFPQLLFFDSLCTKCLNCVKVCPTGASSSNSNGNIHIDRNLCKAFGTCVEACLSKARAISGKLMTVTEVFEIIKQDELFYRNSGGGVTASGGEPTSQSEFLLELFKKCQEYGFHTTLDTCGYVEWRVLGRILRYTDLVLLDIKNMNTQKHIELTGVDNSLILENAKRMVEQEKPIRIRVPLIPGCNDSEENIKATCEFVKTLGLREVDILPYHPLGAKKYRSVGREYGLSYASLYSDAQVEAIKRIFESYDLLVTIA